MLLKHVFLACQWTHVNLICRLYEISYKLVCKKFMSKKKLKKKEIIGHMCHIALLCG
jgi:hypothetical protein